MEFNSFFHEFPHLVESELRWINVFKRLGPIAPGHYAFMEYYCGDESCDCRKVIIEVKTDHESAPIAVFHYGWASREYYVTWMGGDDIGVDWACGISTQAIPADETTEAFMALFKQMLEEDPAYQQRIETHYWHYKRTRQQRKAQERLSKVKTTPIGRNDLCPCHSGKKFKKCCLH